MQRTSLEVVRTAPTDADRFDTEHLVLYIDKGLLSPDAERQFAAAVERGFVAVSEYIRRTYTPTPNAPKPSYYLTNRAGISHASATRVFLFARRFRFMRRSTSCRFEIRLLPATATTCLPRKTRA